MTETIIPIPARLRSSVVGGHVTGAVDIYDDSKEQDQQTINAAVDSEIGTDSTSGTIKGRIKALEENIGPGGSVEEQINAKVATLDATVSQTASTDGLALQVTEVDGKLTGVTGSIAANTYDAHGAAATAKSELLGDAATDYNTLGKLEDKIQAEESRATTAEGLLDGRLDTIEAEIPSAASSTNQLADKDFVNSSVSTATATFRGTSATGLTEAEFLAWADTLTKDNNDYVFWNTVDSAGNVQFKKYKYNGTAWVYEYTLNNSSFTSDQWATINSLLTSAHKTKLDALPTNVELTTLFDGKQDVISDLATIRSGAAAGATAYQKPSGGIPSTDMDSSVQSSLSAADSAYQLPSGGIPDTDLSSAVQTSLGKADTALQSVPTASASVLGGVKVGTNLSIDANGVLSATDTTYSDFVGSGSSHAHGLVPDPGATAGTTKYLREDGTWAVPEGSGGSDTDINYDTTNKKLTKTVDNVTSDVVTASTIVSDGGGIEVEIGNTTPTGDPKIFVDEDADPAVTLDVYTRQETDALLAAKADEATTISGYGITDAYTKTEVDNKIAAAPEQNTINSTDFVVLKDADNVNRKISKANIMGVVKDALAELLLNNDLGTSFSNVPALGANAFGSATLANLASVLSALMETVVRSAGYTSYASMPNNRFVVAYGILSDAPTSSDCVAMHIPFAPASSIIYEVCFGVTPEELGYIWVRLRTAAGTSAWTLTKAS